MCRFVLKPDGCKNGDNCQYAHPRTNEKCLRCGSESHNLQACTRPSRQQSSRSSSVKPAPKKTYAKPKGRAADTQGSNQGYKQNQKAKGKSKGKGIQTKPTAKTGDVDFDDLAQAEHDDQDEEQEQNEPQEEDPEAYVVAAQTSSSESEMESDGMLDWSASECKDYKDCVATVACASPNSFKTHKDA